jgi:hypothetical protein
MKRAVIASTIIGLLAVIVTGTGAAADRDEGHDGRNGREEANGRVIRFSSVNTFFNLVDAPPAATGEGDLSSGDVVLFTDDLTTDGQKIGTDQGVCTVVTGTSAQCAATLILREGKVVIDGAFDVSEQQPNILAITGGTGAFHDADGTAEITHVSSEPEIDDFVLRIDG